jgi:uncharacterized protein involved in outer membrane biogenesis
MKKLLVSLAVILVVLVLAVYLGGQFFLGSAVKAGVNSYGPKLTQTKVELANAYISPVTGSGTLGGLFVGNPPGWSSDKAFYLGRVDVKLKPFSVLGDHVIIEEIVIDQPEFVYETKVVSSNIGDLLKNIEAATGGKKTDEPAAKEEQPRKIEVKKFILRNGRVTIGVGSAAMTISMPPVELTDIGTKEGGVTAQQFAFTVMRAVTASVIQASTQALMKTLPTSGAAAGDAMKNAAEGIKNLFEKKK